MRRLLIVEGASDQIAVETLATRRGVDLEQAEVEVVSLGGAHRIGHCLDELGPRAADRRLAALCDAREAPVFRAAFDRAGLGAERLFVCAEDLEDELIRTLGVEAVEEVLAANGDLDRFRKLQQMPAWRGRATDQQLRRFIAAGARRKGRYARVLVEALDLASAPPPLDGALRAVLS